jgi:TP901-1 family phage major tail protein
MATTGAFNGTSMLLYLAGTALAYSETFSLNINAAEIDATTKSSSGWKTALSGLRDWSVSASGVVALDSASNAKYLRGLVSGRTLVNIKMSTNVSGDAYWHGSGYITNLTIEAPMEDKVTFSCSFVGTGVLTESTKT